MPITDSAYELYLILDKMRKNSSSTQAASVIASTFGCKVDDYTFAEILSYLHRRFDIVRSQVQNSHIVNPDRKDRVLKTVQEVGAILRPSCLVENWTSIKKNYLDGEKLARIEGVSDALRQEFPMRRMSKQDVKHVKYLIDEVKEGIEAERDPIIKTTLEGIVAAFIKTVESEDKFADHEEMTKQLLATGGMLPVVGRMARTREQQALVKKTGVVLATLLNFYVVVPEVPHVTTSFYIPLLNGLVSCIEEWTGAAPLGLPSDSADRVGLPPPPPRLLAYAPVEVAQDDQDDLVSQTGDHSFPASDPPAWIGTAAGGPARR